AVPVVARGTRPRESLDNAGGQVDHPHAVVERVGNVELVAVDGQLERGNGLRAAGPVQLCLRRGNAVAVVARDAGAGEGRDHAGRIDFADPAVALIGDIEVARGVILGAAWEIHLRLRRFAPIAAESLTRAREDLDVAVGVHPLDLSVVPGRQ